MIPMIASALYKAINLRGIFDILRVVFSVISLASPLHTGRNNWGRKPKTNFRKTSRASDAAAN